MLYITFYMLDVALIRFNGVEQQDRHFNAIEDPSVSIRWGPKLLRIKPSDVIGHAWHAQLPLLSYPLEAIP